MDKLNEPQFKNTQELLETPKQMKTMKPSDQMPKAVIKSVWDQLQPFVAELKNKQEAEKNASSFMADLICAQPGSISSSGMKRKHSETDSESVEKKSEADEPNGRQPDEERKMPPWRISIHDLKINGTDGKKATAGKVVQKSGLRTYETRNKEEKFFFYLGVADDTSSIKVMVYGRKRYQFFSEGSFYLFRDIIMEKDAMKVTKKSIISKTAPLDVPENLETEARMLVYAQIPVCSIEQANTAEEKTLVSAEGTIAEIQSVENVKLKDNRGKKDKQQFKLEDGTGSIWIILWGDDIKQLRGRSHGDVVRVTNVRTSHYYDTVSLNSTAFTKIFKIQSAAIQKVTIEIIGIIQASSTQTELDAQIGGGEVQSFVVDSSLVAEGFCVRLEGDFEDRLLEKIPFSADVEIEGNKINRIKLAKETKMSNISQTSCTDVPEKLEMEAQVLVDSPIPVCSITQANSSEENTSVSAEGRVTEVLNLRKFEVSIKNSGNEFRLKLQHTDDESLWSFNIKKVLPPLQNVHANISPKGLIPDDHPESWYIEGKEHFVDEHMSTLIQRVSNIEPILDQLLQERVIQQETYDMIRTLPTSQDKMRKLYRGPLRAGSASKDAFFRILQKHEEMLIADLN